MAVASGGIQAHINEVLEHLGIRQIFQRGGDQRRCDAAKARAGHFPGSGAAAWRAPQFCRAYEDTDLGLQAIRAAGMEAVDVRC